MSQKAARASAREIRRAFGPAAVEHLDTMEAAIRDERMDRIKVCGALQTFANSAHERCDKLEPLIGAAHASLAEFCGRGFLGRLRWLCLGK